MSWKEIDARYVRQGELLLELEFVNGWEGAGLFHE